MLVEAVADLIHGVKSELTRAPRSFTRSASTARRPRRSPARPWRSRPMRPGACSRSRAATWPGRSSTAAIDAAHPAFRLRRGRVNPAEQPFEKDGEVENCTRVVETYDFHGRSISSSIPTRLNNPEN